MRIISQNSIVNQVDLPYERTQLLVIDETVLAKCDGNRYFMASYRTSAQARKAMEMCRSKYNEFMQEKLDVFVSCFVASRVFQFPADEDIEV